MRTWNAEDAVSEQAPGVFFVEGPASNWVVVHDESGFILLDSGYPADRPLVLESIRFLGLEPAECAAVLMTHGHVDHTGSAAHFSNVYGTPVLCAPEELAHVRGEEKHQVTVGQVIRRTWRPRVFRWMLHVIRAGALKAAPAVRAQAWDAATLRRLPGSPEAILLPGHTPGNSSVLLPKVGAIAVGDSFVSGHPLSRRVGAQMLHRMFHSDPAAALAAARRLQEVDVQVILPGHGPALRMPLPEALAAL